MGVAVDFNDPKTWFSGVAAVACGLFAWSAKRNVAEMDHANEDRDDQVRDHSIRIRTLETSMATRSDIEGIYRRLNDLGDTTSEQHARILELLISQQRRQ